MDRKTFSIGILSLSALLLGIACLLPAGPADGAFAVKDLRGTQLVTVASQAGGDILFVIDQQSGKLLLLGYNNNSKDLRTLDVRPLDAVFGK